MTHVPATLPQRRLTLKQEAANYIRDLIFSGQLRPGQKLDQDALADTLGLSRLPVREALIMLEAEGMVNNVARRGAFVGEIESDDIVDHFHMYGVLSGIAAQRVAQDPPPELLGELRTLSQRMRSATESSEHDQLNYLFHRTINRAGGSRRLKSVLRILSDNMPTHFFDINAEWQFRGQAFDEHDSIVEAIAAGDGAAAAAALASHFAHVGEQAVCTLRNVGFWDRPTES
ncbi:MAG: GntR family transcriptional regulator [Propionibacteriaceae bacterium]|nr:GntR family transcriptional regulator [Propionibacteriaceae bacterium]